MRRFAIAGFPEERLHLMGSMKYDVAALAADHPGKGGELRKAAGWENGQVILLGGSTHPGEEKILAEMAKRLIKKHPQLRLMLVPRHVERTASILLELAGTGLRVVKRSELSREGKTDPEILLVDTTGELRDLYPTADVVFIGKTVTGTGGQNFLEAARHGRAIVAGPHMENFMPLRREFEEANGIRVTASAAELEEEVDRLLGNHAERDALGRRASVCFQGHLGAGKRCAEILVGKISEAEQAGQQK
jgi:3-deoxy-D-manno-octulosonic-acid transferase